jgi:hypothetical protein
LTVAKELVELRFQTLNKRRHHKRQMIIELRQKIIDEEAMARQESSGLRSKMGSVKSSIANPLFNQSSLYNLNPMNSSVYSLR